VQTQVAELSPEVGGKEVVVVDCGGTRCDLVGREALHNVAQHFNGFAEVEREARKVVHVISPLWVLSSFMRIKPLPGLPHDLNVSVGQHGGK